MLHASASIHLGFHRKFARPSAGTSASAHVFCGLHNAAYVGGYRLRGNVFVDVGEGIDMDNTAQRGDVDLVRHVQRFDYIIWLKLFSGGTGAGGNRQESYSCFCIGLYVSREGMSLISASYTPALASILGFVASLRNLVLELVLHRTYSAGYMRPLMLAGTASGAIANVGEGLT